jgi:hypothetical protein
MPRNARGRLTLVGYDTDQQAAEEASRSLSGLDVKAVDVTVAEIMFP